MQQVQQYTIPDEVVQLLQQVQHYLRFRGDIIAMQLHSQIHQMLNERVYPVNETDKE